MVDESFYLSLAAALSLN